MHLYAAQIYFNLITLPQAIVKTGISIALPDGCYGRIAPRSGLAAKHHIDIGAGVVDKDYRGAYWGLLLLVYFPLWDLYVIS